MNRERVKEHSMKRPGIKGSFWVMGALFVVFLSVAASYLTSRRISYLICNLDWRCRP
ncbi:MAG: hypothetical protein ACOX6D_02060 [Thermoguttaceae bacterium]